jgi:hypothetical protein
VARKLGKLGMDLDGTLYPWHEVAVEDLISRGILDVGITSGEFFDPENGIIVGWDDQKRQELLLNKVPFYSQPVEIAGARKVMDVLKESWEIFYITARPLLATAATKAWLKRMKFPYRNNLFLVDGGKKDITDLLGIDVFVEDRVDYILELSKICSMILLTRPWNENYKGNDHVRVDTLHELIPLLDGGIDDISN